MIHKVYVRTIKTNEAGDKIQHDVCIISSEDKHIATETAVLNIKPGQQVRIEAGHVIVAVEVHDTMFWLDRAPAAKYFYPPKTTQQLSDQIKSIEAAIRDNSENPVAACGMRIPAAYAI